MNDILLLQCSHLTKCYQEGNLYTEVLRNVNLSMYYGEMIAVVGNSGSGKSTLLHLLGGLEKPTSGEVIFEGHLLSNLSTKACALLRNRRLGFIYQFYNLLPDFTALENVAMPLLIGGILAFQAQEIARDMLALVGLDKRRQHRPSELSGGEKQRVAIARALVNHPSLVLADEPTGNLDSHNVDSIFELLSNLNIRQGTAFLIVTHDLQLAQRLHRQLEMRDGILRAKNMSMEDVQ